MRDIQIITPGDGDAALELLGASNDTGLMLLQRVMVLLLSSANDSFRSDDTLYSLPMFLEGGNIPEDAVMNTILALCCTYVLDELDAADREHIQTLTATSEGGVVTCNIELTDGTTISGVLPYA